MNDTKLLRFAKTFPVRELEMLERDGHFDRYARREAERALAAALMREGSNVIEETRPIPDPDDYRGGYAREVRWTIGVVSREQTRAAKAQQDEAYARGVEAAAAIVATMADRYRNSASEGMCKHVIAGALEDAALAISAHNAHSARHEHGTDAPDAQDVVSVARE